MRTLIICCENRGGMMFNNRRLSMDTMLNEKLEQRFKKETFYIAEYSKSLFPNGVIFDNFENDGVYFIEDPDLIPEVVENIFDTILIVKWNRDYPYDKTMPFNLNYYKLRRIIEFEGYAHDKITLSFYNKRGDM